MYVITSCITTVYQGQGTADFHGKQVLCTHHCLLIQRFNIDNLCFLFHFSIPALPGLPMYLTMSSDLLWHLCYYFGSVALISLDAAVLITRRVKLIVCALWICNSIRLLYQTIFVYALRPYFLRLMLCVPLTASSSIRFGPADDLDPEHFDSSKSECFSFNVIRLQVVFSLLLFSLKQTHSLLFNPRAVVILRASIVYELEPEPEPESDTEPRPTSASEPEIEVKSPRDRVDAHDVQSSQPTHRPTAVRSAFDAEPGLAPTLPTRVSAPTLASSSSTMTKSLGMVVSTEESHSAWSSPASLFVPPSTGDSF